MDVGDRKPATAYRLGATHTVNSRAADPVDAVREPTGAPTPELRLELPPLDALVTGTVALDEAEKAFEMTRHGDVLRSVVVL